MKDEREDQGLRRMVAAARMAVRPTSLSLAITDPAANLHVRIASELVAAALSDPFGSAALSERGESGAAEPEVLLAPSKAGVDLTVQDRSPEGMLLELSDLLEQLGYDASGVLEGGIDVAASATGLHLWLLSHASSAARPLDAAIYGHDATVALGRILARAAGSRGVPAARLEEVPEVPRYLRAKKGPAADPRYVGLADALDGIRIPVGRICREAGLEVVGGISPEVVTRALSDLTAGASGGSAVVRGASMAAKRL